MYLKGTNIRINSLSPRVIDTPILRNGLKLDEDMYGADLIVDGGHFEI